MGRPPIYDPNANDRKCYVCKRVKPLAMFRKDAECRSKVGGMCLKCSANCSKVWRLKNIEKARTLGRISDRKRNATPERKAWAKEWRRRNADKVDVQKLRARCKRYGISMPDYLAAITRQNSCCICCGEPFKPGEKRQAYIDHDHKTGKLRDILCIGCNTGLGCFKDSPDLLRKAIQYLSRHGIS